MKKFCIILSLAAVTAAPNLFAAMSVTLLDNTSSYSSGVGGEFKAVGNAGLDSVVNWSAYSTSTAGGSQKGTAGVNAGTDGSAWGYNSSLNGQSYFQTFCIEYSEEFNPGTSYTVSSIGNSALYNGTGQPVPITMAVAYLYSQFAAGTLKNYSYSFGSDREASAQDLQNAIWALLGEHGSLNVTGNAYLDLMAVTGSGLLFGSMSDWYNAANGAYGVQSMTLGQPGQAQDQLVIVVPEPSTVIAAALLLLPFGVSTIRILRKARAV